jgi:hypothetical protein
MELIQNVNYVISNARLVMPVATIVSCAKEIESEIHVLVQMKPMMIFLQLNV